eukprot:25953-Rhodomonas_salina.1
MQRAPVPMVLVLEEEATSSDNQAHAHTRASHFWEWGSLHEHAPLRVERKTHVMRLWARESGARKICV